MTDRETIDESILFNTHADGIQCLAGIGCHGLSVQKFQILAKNATDRPRGCYFTIQFNIVCHIEAGNQHKFLMNHTDSFFHCVHRGDDIHLLAVNENVSLKTTCRMDDRHSEENVHQGRFACAIFS